MTAFHRSRQKLVVLSRMGRSIQADQQGEPVACRGEAYLRGERDFVTTNVFFVADAFHGSWHKPPVHTHTSLCPIHISSPSPLQMHLQILRALISCPNTFCSNTWETWDFLITQTKGVLCVKIVQVAFLAYRHLLCPSS